MRLFIRNESQPAGQLELGQNHPGFEFKNNALQVADDDTALIFAMQAGGYEEVASDDPRRDFILEQGWSRHSQQDYQRMNPTPPPEE